LAGEVNLIEQEAQTGNAAHAMTAATMLF
jgi:hypothetical protein